MVLKYFSIKTVVLIPSAEEKITSVPINSFGLSNGLQMTIYIISKRVQGVKTIPVDFSFIS